MKSLTRIEILETRIAPATLNLAGGVLTYTAAAGFTNVLTLNVSGANYTFGDTGETITLNTAATNAGFSGSGTNNISGPTSAVSSISILLGSGTDVFNLNGLVDPLTMIDGADADTVNVATGSDLVGGSLSLAAETMTITSLAGVTNLTLSADTLAINGGVDYTGTLAIAPITVDRPINLGTETAGSLSLTANELNNVIHSGTTRIGSATAGAITVSASIVGIAGTLVLRTGGGITDTPSGGIQGGSLVIDADASVTLDGANDVAGLAATLSDAGADLLFTQGNSFQIVALEGVSGLTSGSGGFVQLSAGAPVTQQATARIIAGGLRLSGNASYTLNSLLNDVDTIAANIGGALNFVDLDGLAVGAVNGAGGITTTNRQVSLTAGNGDLIVQNGNGAAAADISVGTASVSLTAGGEGADFAITISANAGITAGAVTLRADHIGLGAAVNATTSATVQIFETATAFALGGADGAATLGLTDAELDFITTPTLTIGSGQISEMTISQSLTLASIGTLILNASNITGGGAVTVPVLSFNSGGGFSLSGASDVNELHGSVGAGAVTFNDADGFAVGSPLPFNPASAFALLSTAPTQRTLNASGGVISFLNTDDAFFTLGGVTPGSGHDQWTVSGGVNLTGASLSLSIINGFTPTAGTELVLISNDGADAIAGTFSNRSEGEIITVNGRNLRLSYTGGDGNDVTLTVPNPLAVTIVPGGKVATFTDVDGDLVTVKTTKGVFDGSEFVGIETGANGAGQLQRLVLDADFTGANITLSAKRSANGGNGFVNLGFLDATGVDLGAVVIAGDLGRLVAGTAGGNEKVPALKSLTVQTLGLLGTSTQGSTGTLGGSVTGALPKLTVKDDIRGGSFSVLGATDGRLGTVTIGGSIAATSNVTLSAAAGIGALKVGGDIRTTSNGFVSIRSFGGAFGAISVSGSIVGVDVGHTVEFSAFGQSAAPSKGLDLALKSLAVKGSVERLTIFAGGLANANADASIGSITVGGDWIASTAVAGTGGGADFVLGSADDTKVTVIVPAARDAAALFSAIGSFIVKGQALGTASTTSDMFGIVAERIGKAKVGGRTFAFTTGATPEAFFAAPTFDGAGTENPAFDFTIRELGSTTPVPAFGGPNLVVSTDGKTATFTDVDGDLVTVKRTLGTFATGDFAITANTSGGGQLTQLVITAAPGNLTITAKPGPNGGNGLVNVGGINAGGIALGSVSIAGDLGSISGGQSVGGKPGTAALSVHSFGTLGTSTGAFSTLSSFAGGVGKVAVAADFREASLLTIGAGAFVGTITIGGNFVGGFTPASIITEGNFGTVKIGGSMRNAVLSATGTIGAIAIGGDLIGDGANSTIFAFGQKTAPTKGADVAIKSLTVKGSVEKARIEAGTGGADTNADASIGAISVGRAWLASSVLAGVDDGTDNVLGTADDTKDLGTTSTRDRAGIFSTIASIVIKGQAFGSAAAGDSFGIVAEQIGKAQIGAVKFKFDKGERDAADAFAAAPTGPGPAPDNATSDFFLREIVV